MNAQSRNIFKLYTSHHVPRDQHFGGGSDPSALLAAVAYKLATLGLFTLGPGSEGDGAARRCMNELIYSKQPATQTPGWAGGVWREDSRGGRWGVGLSHVVFCGGFGHGDGSWGVRVWMGEAMWETAAVWKKNTKKLDDFFFLFSPSFPHWMKSLSLETQAF